MTHTKKTQTSRGAQMLFLDLVSLNKRRD